MSQPIEIKAVDMFCLKSAREWVRSWARSGTIREDKKGEHFTEGATPEEGVFRTPLGNVSVKKVASIPNVRSGYWNLCSPRFNECHVQRKVDMLEYLAIELVVGFGHAKSEQKFTKRVRILVKKFGMNGGMEAFLDETKLDVDKLIEDVKSGHPKPEAALASK